MLLIFVVSSFEIHAPVVQQFPMRDKGVHFLQYAALGWLCASAAAQASPARGAWRTLSIAFAVAALWGVSDEVHQAFVPGRSAEVADVVADALGAFAGVVVWRMFSNRSVS